MKFGDFEIRPVPNMDGTIRPGWYELIKWYKTDTPIVVTDGKTGEKKLQDTFCYVVAFLTLDKDEEWEFRSVGFRYLEDRVDGLESYIMKYCDLIKECKEKGQNEE